MLSSLQKIFNIHQNIGVDYFLICDLGSTDQSLSQIHEMANNERISVLELDINRPGTDVETIQNAQLIAFQRIISTFSPDWVMLSDTDDFWVPRWGNIRGTKGLSDSELLSVRRLNAALALDTVSGLSERLQDVHMLTQQEIIVDPIALSTAVMKDDPDIPWVMGNILPKIMTAVRDVESIAVGFHDLESASALRRSIPSDLLILHLPFTTYGRFKEKLDKIREHNKLLSTIYDSGGAWHWKRWFDELRDPKAEYVEFEKQFFGLTQLQTFRKSKRAMKIKDYFDIIDT